MSHTFAPKHHADVGIHLAAPIDELAGFLTQQTGRGTFNPNNPLAQGANPSANPANPQMNPSNPGAYANPSNPQFNPNVPGSATNPSNAEFNPSVPGSQTNPSNPIRNPDVPGAMTNPSNPQLNPYTPNSITNPSNPIHNPDYPDAAAIGAPPSNLGPNASFPPHSQMTGAWHFGEWDYRVCRQCGGVMGPSFRDGQAILSQCTKCGMYHELPERQSPYQWQSTWKLAGNWDPTVCAQCGGPMGEPHQMGQHWTNRCLRCGLTKEVPNTAPLFKQYQQQEAIQHYPDLLQSVGPERPWVFASIDTWHLADDATSDSRNFPDPLEPRPSSPPVPKGCTCPIDHKLDCPVHGLHPVEPDMDHAWSVPEGNPVGYPQSAPQGWQTPYLSSWEIVSQTKSATEDALEPMLWRALSAPVDGMDSMSLDHSIWRISSQDAKDPVWLPVHDDDEAYIHTRPHQSDTNHQTRSLIGSNLDGRGTYQCVGCGQGLMDNAHRGYTPVTDGKYGLASGWRCPTCELDLRPVENRPMLMPDLPNLPAPSETPVPVVMPRIGFDFKVLGSIKEDFDFASKVRDFSFDPIDDKADLFSDNNDGKTSGWDIRHQFQSVLVEPGKEIASYVAGSNSNDEDDDQSGNEWKYRGPQVSLKSIYATGQQYDDDVGEDLHGWKISTSRTDVVLVPANKEGQQEKERDDDDNGKDHGGYEPEANERQGHTDHHQHVQEKSPDLLEAKLEDLPEVSHSTSHPRQEVIADVVAGDPRAKNREDQLKDEGKVKGAENCAFSIAKVAGNEQDQEEALQMVGLEESSKEAHDQHRSTEAWSLEAQSSSDESDYEVTVRTMKRDGYTDQEIEDWADYLAMHNEADRDSGELRDVPTEQVERWYENWESEGRPHVASTSPQPIEDGSMPSPPSSHTHHLRHAREKRHDMVSDMMSDVTLNSSKDVTPHGSTHDTDTWLLSSTSELTVRAPLSSHKRVQRMIGKSAGDRWYLSEKEGDPHFGSHPVPGIGHIDSMDDIRALFDPRDPESAVADNLDLDTVTPEMIQEARQHVQQASQAKLAPHAQDGHVSVYRAGPLRPGQPNSFSLVPSQHHEGVHGAPAQAYSLPLEHVLGYSEAFTGANPYPGETEVLAHPEHVTPSWGSHQGSVGVPGTPVGLGPSLIHDYDFYHFAPTEERARIKQHGLQASNPVINNPWLNDGQARSGVHVVANPNNDMATEVLGNKPYDTWKVTVRSNPDGTVPWENDPHSEGFVLPTITPEQLQLHTPHENRLNQWGPFLGSHHEAGPTSVHEFSHIEGGETQPSASHDDPAWKWDDNRAAQEYGMIFRSYGDAVPGGYNGGFAAYHPEGNRPYMGHIEYNSANNDAVIADLQVHPNYRRQGVATKLFDYAQRYDPEMTWSHGMTTPEGEAWRQSLGSHKDTSLVEPLEPHLTTYHGTTNRAIELAQEKGGLYAWSPHDVANEIGSHYGLDPQELYNHPYFSFSRDAREGDPYIYTHTDPNIALIYAKAGSEQLQDGIHTAHRIIHPEMYDAAAVEGFAGGSKEYRKALKDSRNQFENDYWAQHDIKPVVTTLQVPHSSIREREQGQLQYPDERGNPQGTFTFPSPVPLDWMSTPTPEPEPPTSDPRDWEIPDPPVSDKLAELQTTISKLAATITEMRTKPPEPELELTSAPTDLVIKRDDQGRMASIEEVISTDQTKTSDTKKPRKLVVKRDAQGRMASIEETPE